MRLEPLVRICKGRPILFSSAVLAESGLPSGGEKKFGQSGRAWTAPSEKIKAEGTISGKFIAIGNQDNQKNSKFMTPRLPRGPTGISQMKDLKPKRLWGFIQLTSL